LDTEIRILIPECTGTSVSVSDPDLDWIRIQEGKNNPQKIKKGKKFHVLFEVLDVGSLLRAVGFSCCLDVL
jgi:hypothetical protein